MKTTIHLPKGLLTNRQKAELTEHTSLEESYFERCVFRGWWCNKNHLIQEEIDLEKLVKLSRHFEVEIAGEHIYLGG